MTVKDEWQTPLELFKKLDEEFHFDLDVACKKGNCLCFCGNTKENRNSLLNQWVAQYHIDYVFWPVCFMNPPYSKSNLYNFCRKAYEESQRGCVVVGLLPCDCSTKWWSEFVMKADEIRFLSRRVRFIDPETGKLGGSPTFGSVIVVWKQGDHTPKVSSWSW